MPIFENIKAANYIGSKSYWNYFNSDSNGIHPKTCCGQAAIYSFLRTKSAKQKSGFSAFVTKYPPDMLWGSCGSSWQRIREILNANGYKFGVQYGEGALRTALKSGPVIVCLDIGAAGWSQNGLHWVTVFGYTKNNYYLTQWEGSDGNHCSRENFNNGWNTWLTNGVSATTHACYIPYK